MDELQRAILESLRDEQKPRKARWFARELSVSRREANQALYGLLRARQVVVDDHYRWSLWHQEQKAPEALLRSDDAPKELVRLLREVL